jgi:hypothetical protein
MTGHVRNIEQVFLRYAVCESLDDPDRYILHFVGLLRDFCMVRVLIGDEQSWYTLQGQDDTQHMPNCIRRCPRNLKNY